jgi:diaminohydroxyphosphoribosylaminopyrimidine deaminase/5-amino-6-(5-phosphoribosylamino)uracil reductase
MPEPEISAFMQSALDAAARAGNVSPNPAVGCVIVKDGAVIGEGVTQPPGSEHAEAMALRIAGDAARGATAYVTLEPCSHHGRTPPCTDALIAAGVAKVVYAIDDPDERVSGRGRARLEAAGIAVEAGDGAEAANVRLEAYLKHRRTGLPFVTVKYAATLDGRIAAGSGDSRWVSGPETLKWAHRNRPGFDAMLVGSSTVVIDNPLLTARPEGIDNPHQPLRVVVDSRGRIDPGRNVLLPPRPLGEGRGEGVPTLVATTEASDLSWRRSIKATGAEVVVYPAAGAEGHVDLTALLRDLGGRGVLSLLVEGGGVIIGSFFDQRLVDKVTLVIAPLIVGAADAPTAVAGHGARYMRDAVRLREMTVDRLGDDILVTGYPVWPET